METHTQQEFQLFGHLQQVWICPPLTEFYKIVLSQSLMVQEGTHNHYISIKGSPKKFWGLFGQKAHETQQITLFHTEKQGLSFTLKSHGWTDSPIGFPNETLRFTWDGSMHSTPHSKLF